MLPRNFCLPASVLFITLLGVGCQTTHPANVPAAARDGKVTGQVYFLQKMAVLPDSTLDVSLVDVTDTTHTKTIATESKKIQSVPAPYTLKFKPTAITEGRVYEVHAQLTMGGRVWTHTMQYPVLTGGAPNYAEIVVSPK